MEAGATVFVVDDDPSIRKALSRLIGSAGYQVESFTSAEDFLAKSHQDGASCLILDVSMPGLDGIQLQEKLKAAGVIIPIIFLTGHGDIPMSVKAMKAGALDFIPKPVEDETLLQAIEFAIARNVERRQARSEIEEVEGRVKTLTPREYEVMGLVVTGLLNKQIAFKLGISEKTIKVHRARVMEKMQAGSVAELVRLTEKLDIA